MITINYFVKINSDRIKLLILFTKNTILGYINSTSHRKKQYILDSSLHKTYRIQLADNVLVRLIFLLIVCNFYSVFLLSQAINLGTPLIKNYPKEVYLGGTQSWDAIYGQNLIYFANNDGLISFNGTSWNLHQLPYKTILRSIAESEDGRLYAGGQDELGYFLPNENGELTFTSIKDNLPESNKKLEDIWEIEVIGEIMFFRSNNLLFKYVNGIFSKFGTGSPMTFIAKHQNTIIYNDLNEGLFVLKDDQTTFITGSDIFKYIAIIDLIPLKEQDFLVLTERNGVYAYQNGQFQPWDTNAKSYLIENRISSGVSLPNGNLAIGTLLGGLLIFNDAGQVIFRITKENGLQNNSISTLCTDNVGNIWIGSYHGIDQINLKSGMSLILPDGNLEGAVYDVTAWRDWLFFGTNNGLYYIEKRDYYNPLEPMEFKLIKYSAGQVWGLDIIDDQLLMAHNDGAFFIDANLMEAHKFSVRPGAWKFIKLSENRMVAGGYSGLDIYEKKGERWAWKKQVDGFSESSRIIVLDKQNNLWVTHPYRGVYKFTFDEKFEAANVEQMEEEDGVLTNQGNYVFNINETAVITNPEAIYTYNPENEIFEDQAIISSKFDEAIHIKRLIQSAYSIWYISEDGAGEILTEEIGLQRDLSIKKYPNIGNVFVGGFEHLYQLNEDHIFLCTDKGVLHFDKKNYSFSNKVKAKISGFKLLQPHDSILFTVYNTGKRKINLRSNENNVKFNFTNDFFQDPEQVLYNYQLKGIDMEWSGWTTTNSKEYTNLNNGNYEFLLKAKDPLGNISEVVSCPFFIKAPWYKSIWALLFYACLILGFLMSLVLIPRKKFNTEKAILESAQKKKEEEVETLKNEKLETEIQFKNKELASTTMHLLQKNETLNTLRSKIVKIQKDLKDPEDKRQLKKLINLIESDTQLEDDWTKFSYHFDQVHRNFLTRIKQNYPHLSSKDLKLCAYLRMNLSTKEIAPLLSISVRGVEISRYRLRKKLALEKEVNLNEFMVGY